jgi:DNA end-binding protein Ku
MPRAIWSGAISFGLVNIPVKLFSAIDSHRVAFHEFEEGTGERVQHKRVSAKGGREIPWGKIQKGFEVGKGRYVMLTEEELRTAEPGRTGSIEIEQFVSLGEIDPVTWDQTYYLGPDGAAAAKAYALLRQVMEDRKRVAIGRFVMRTKEYVTCIRPFEKILALETMFYADEVRSTKEVGAVPGKVSLGQRELAMAGQLVESLTTPWRHDKYRDTFSQRVEALARKKDKGQTIDVPDSSPGPSPVIDLMAALQATLAGKKTLAPAPAAQRRSPATARRKGARAATRTATRAGRSAPKAATQRAKRRRTS